MLALTVYEKNIFIHDTETGQRSTFRPDGSILWGDLILKAERVRFLAWRQRQDIRWSDDRCEREWEKLQQGGK